MTSLPSITAQKNGGNARLISDMQLTSVQAVGPPMRWYGIVPQDCVWGYIFLRLKLTNL